MKAYAKRAVENSAIDNKQFKIRGETHSLLGLCFSHAAFRLLLMCREHAKEMKVSSMLRRRWKDDEKPSPRETPFPVPTTSAAPGRLPASRKTWPHRR